MEMSRNRITSSKRFRRKEERVKEQGEEREKERWGEMDEERLKVESIRNRRKGG